MRPYGRSRESAARETARRQSAIRRWQRGAKLQPGGRRRGRAPRHAAENSDEKALLFEPVIEVGDVFAVAVPFKGRPPPVDAEHPLGRLAPARMRHARIDV